MLMRTGKPRIRRGAFSSETVDPAECSSIIKKVSVACFFKLELVQWSCQSKLITVQPGSLVEPLLNLRIKIPASVPYVLIDSATLMVGIQVRIH